MKEITLAIEDGTVPLSVLRERLGLLHRRGLTDAGLMLVSLEGWLRGYITQTELEYALNNLASFPGGTTCRMLTPVGESGTTELEDISVFVDRTPIMMGKDTPVEVVAEVFGKVGCRYVCIVEDGKGVGVVIKKRFLMFMEEMAGGMH
jgi:chloride channel 3/4/5